MHQAAGHDTVPKDQVKAGEIEVDAVTSLESQAEWSTLDLYHPLEGWSLGP